MNVPAKVKHLTWHACQNSLPTKTNLVKHNVLTDGLCEIYKLHQEDMIRALYRCQKLETFWNAIPLWNHGTLKQSNSFMTLLGLFWQIIVTRNYSLQSSGLYGIGQIISGWVNTQTTSVNC